MHYFRHKKEVKRGFTLMELLIAMTLFAIVSVSAVASLVILMSGQKKAIFLQTNQDNIRFALESLSREIRLGYNYTQADFCLDPSILVPSECFEFTNSRDETIVFKLSKDPNECFRDVGNTDGCVVRCNKSVLMCDQLGAFEPLTAPEVNIESLKFFIAGDTVTDPTNINQSRVTIVLKGVTPGADVRQARVNVQTTVSRLQRD